MGQVWDIVLGWGIPTLLTTLVAMCGAGGVLRRWATHNRRQDELLIFVAQELLTMMGERYLEKGCITVTELEKFERLHRRFNSLDGEGVGDIIYEQVKQIKIREDC
ncbi:MAG: hypothetical protein UDB11_00785 [Peptococcaceae bacterium]|nr:hypothetical protein [Peptococcaceae bacterium]